MPRSSIKYLLVLLALLAPAPSYAEGLEPESALVTTSAKGAFTLDTRLPKEWWFALDQQIFFGLTAIHVSERSIAAGGQSLLTKADRTCSIYDSAVCFDTGHFYHAQMPQIILSGFFKLDGNSALLLGLDTGYRAEKITVSPALMLGLSHRVYLNEKRDTQFIMEAAAWLGQSVDHTPCIDSKDRLYYCGNLSAWSDFSYNPHPSELYLKLWYDYAF